MLKKINDGPDPALLDWVLVEEGDRTMASPARSNVAAMHFAAVAQESPEELSSQDTSRGLSEAESATSGDEAAGVRPEELRLLEALLFAATEPLDEASLAKRMPDGVVIKTALAQLQADYAMRGVNLVKVAGKWTFRTAGDLAWLMTRESVENRRLSRAAIEMLAIIAYHQPVTRAEIEEIRGVVTSKGTLDVLLETGWIRPRGRRKTPGRPLTFGTTESFLSQFTLEALGDLPGLEEMKGAGLLDTRLPSGFSMPSPSDDPQLREDEEPLEAGDLELALVPPIEPEPDQEPAAETADADAPEAIVAEAVAVEIVEAEGAEVAVIEAIVTEVDVTEADLAAMDAAATEFAEPEAAEADMDADLDAEAETEAEGVAETAAEMEAEPENSGES
jgi:segregation and condensation protein B